ncbi:hypothetical protein ACE38W_14795 [Chitinophaga sp. Hz27]|uniref:hypothetical protein n=1 Tax=Chitinophaga sp. Hz27 TaxID=3347169 RepID=UPI0035E22990
MNSELNLPAVEAIHTELLQMDSLITGLQSITALIDLSGRLSAWLAFTGEQMAAAKREWRASTRKAYESHVFSRVSQSLRISPSMATDYAKAKSGDNEATYEFCERVHRTITHIIDLVRTVISALKEEQKVFGRS